MKTYIYVLKDPETMHIRYVGKTIYPNKRFNSHKCIKGTKGTYLSSWVVSLRNKNLVPLMEIIDEIENDGWKEKESYYIEFYKKQGCRLVNLTEGGEGCEGYKHTESSKQKMSKISKGKMPKYIPTFYGKKHSIESLNKMNLYQSGEKNPNYGKKVSEEMKISLSKKLGSEVIINGTAYTSLRQAAKSMNVLWATFRYRYKMGLQLSK